MSTRGRSGQLRPVVLWRTHHPYRSRARTVTGGPDSSATSSSGSSKVRTPERAWNQWVRGVLIKREILQIRNRVRMPVHRLPVVPPHDLRSLALCLWMCAAGRFVGPFIALLFSGIGVRFIAGPRRHAVAYRGQWLLCLWQI